jgi:eukaryotic-like serine/threonine-protein kinase
MSTRTIRPLEAGAALLALLGLAAFLSHWVLDGVIHSRKTQTVPDLRGKSLLNAMDMLAPLNLGMKKESVEFDGSVPVGAVLRQLPPAGTIVREGKVIRVTISQGGETVFVPNVASVPLRNAEMMLRQAQLVLGEVSETPSLRLEKGVVVSQEPKPDSSVERSALVNLVISAGPPPEGVTLMPDFLRKDVEEARAWADGAGVTMSVSKDASSAFPAGTILSQTPPADAALAKSAAVSFVVSGRNAKSKVEEPASKMFHYELSQGGAEAVVRVVVADKYGERELFSGTKKPGSKIDLPIKETGGARVKIFVNGVLVEERDL